MKLFSVLRKYSSASTLWGAIGWGVAGGGLSTVLLFLINEAMFGDGSWNSRKGWMTFLVLLPTVAVVRFLASYTLMKLGTKAAYTLQIELTRRILAAPLRRLEELGSHRLLVALTDDIMAVTDALAAIPVFFINISVVIGCLGYLGWLDWKLLLVVLGFLAVGVLTYQMPMSAGVRRQELAREEEDGLFEHFRGVTQGTKELKMHRGRRADFFESLGKSAGALRDLRLSSMKIFIAAASWGSLLFFALLGFLVFGIPRWFGPIEQQTMLGFGMVLLYILGPLQAVLNGFPTLTRAEVAVRKVERLGVSLGKDPEEMDSAAPAAPRWQNLELQGIRHSYRVEGEEKPFTLGPLDVSFTPGEVVFIVGGNGSGKTTLAKLLLGLYPPDEGAIVLDGRPVPTSELDAYRQHFSVVFSDFFLFDQLLGLGAEGLDERAREYLERLRLQHKVRVENGRLSTVDLSQGQRKRLALLTAWLEDSPIFLFDEWAADQDPEFKEVFYHQLLPALKSRGKLVLVISHDDRYYGVADRVIKLDYGALVYDRPTAATEYAAV